MDINSYELAMWEAAKNKDVDGFQKLVCDDAVMVCGGYRCTGKEYAQYIASFGISDYSILVYETIYASEELVQNHYVVETKVNKPDDADMAGTFHVTSSWKRFDGDWRLIFNMDSRIIK